MTIRPSTRPLFVMTGHDVLDDQDQELKRVLLYLLQSNLTRLEAEALHLYAVRALWRLQMEFAQMSLRA